MRAYVLMVLGLVAVGGCAASPSRKAPTPATTAQDVNAPADANAPQDANSPGNEVLDELEAELTQKQKQATVSDPLEPVNRFMFGVNDVLYFWVVKPVTQVYCAVVPKPARTGIGNFFHNVATPVRIVNCIFQGKNAQADTELQRFAINTTVGVLGFGDPARDRWKLEPTAADLGQTLGVHGVGDGFYLMWPLLGPSTLRDSVGMVGDGFLSPFWYIQAEEVTLGISATSAVNGASLHTGEYETLKAAAVDPYVAIREAYIQYRQKQIRGDVQSADPNRVKP